MQGTLRRVDTAEDETPENRHSAVAMPWWTTVERRTEEEDDPSDGESCSPQLNPDPVPTMCTLLFCPPTGQQNTITTPYA